MLFATCNSPHSLGKLIEWKRQSNQASRMASQAESPLAGETN